MTRQNWSGKTHGWGPGILIFIALIKRCGFAPAYVLLVPVCFFYTIVRPKARNAVRQFRRRLGLRTSFFDCYAHFYSFSLSIIHRAGLLMASDEKKGCKIRYRACGEDKIEAAVKSGGGVILLSAHIGNFWIAAEILAKRLNSPINVIMVERDGDKIRKVYEKVDKNRKIKVIALDKDPVEVALKIKDALQNGEIVAALGDRYLDGNVAEIEFLGEKAKFARGIFEIAALTQTPIIPVFMTRQKLEFYNFSAGDTIYIESGDRKRRKEFIYAAMREFVSQVERQAANTPLQWYNFYDFWGGDDSVKQACRKRR